MSEQKMSAPKALVDRFRTWNRTRIARRRLAKDAIMTVHGFYFNGLRGMQDGSFEPEETALVTEIFKSVDLFLNVGANSGYYCCFAQQQGIKTIAVEPVPSNVTYIAQNMAANGWGDNITVLPVAAGEVTGFIDIYGVGTGASVVKGWANNPETLRQTVPVVRLETLIHPAPDGQTMFVLMDVEGFEYHALKGAAALINAANKPVWFIEVIGDGGPVEAGIVRFADTFKMMMDAGYAVYMATDNFPKLEWDDILRLENSPKEQDASRNYLFLDKDKDIKDLIGIKNQS